MNILKAEDIEAAADPVHDMTAAIATPDGKIYSLSRPRADDTGEIKLKWKCTVASSIGERFHVLWWPEQPKALPDNYKRFDLRATIYIDGVKVEQRVLKARDWLQGHYGWVEGQQANESSVRHFRWGSRELLDKDAGPNTNLTHGDLNTVRVIVEWGSPPPGSRNRQTRIAPYRWSPVRVRLSDTQFNNTSAAVLEDPAPFEDDLVPERPMFRRAQGTDRFTFTFKYAPQDWIDAQGIVLYDHASDERTPRNKRQNKRQ